MISCQFSRMEILAQPPTMTLAILAKCLGRSEPTIRKAHRSGELAELGIKINKLGHTYVVVTESVWRYLGLSDGASNGSVPPAHRESGGTA
jgi:hypothetical protein